jgi:hypothetical protein
MSMPGADELRMPAPHMLAGLTRSFSHVLGIDGDLLNITAAKELKAAGRLCFKPVADSDQQQEQQQQDEMCVVQVPEDVDRDRVRWAGLLR